MAYQGERSEVIYQAFLETIEVLGEPVKSAIIEELEHEGIDLRNANLEKLAAILRQTVSADASALIVQQVLKRLDDPLYKIRSKSKS